MSYPFRNSQFFPLFRSIKLMTILNKRESLILVSGDVALFILALWLMLGFRYGFLPIPLLFFEHLLPFSMLFVIWLVVFFFAGLYEKHTLILRSRLPNIFLKAELTNGILALVFFYFIPYFGITPKINLFIYLVISFSLVFVWRMRIYQKIGSKNRQKAVIIGTGNELIELTNEVNKNPRYSIEFTGSYELDLIRTSDILPLMHKLKAEGVNLAVLDLGNQKIEALLPDLYKLMFAGVQCIDIYKLYEDIFDRIPLSLVKYSWFLGNISLMPRVGYDALKRIMDVSFSIVGGLASLVFYPFIVVMIKLDDGGPVFIFQERVGSQGKIIQIVKFRTMTIDDEGRPNIQKNNRATRVGPFLRKSRLDELPQFWNVFRGDLSLVGPRPELPNLVSVYEREVPYYGVRHLIKPGLCGWAQLYHENHPHHNADVLETRVKLSYDLYYIKNRSLFLDLKIALKTLKTLLSRSGV